MLPISTLWRIARRDLAARIRGLRLLAVCLFLPETSRLAMADHDDTEPRRPAPAL